jgi:hypothetical protein
MSDSTIASTTGGSLNELAGKYCVELERLNYGRETINLYLRSIRRLSQLMLELLEMAALPELSAAIEPLLRVREGMRTERKLADRTLAASARRSDVGRRLMTIPGVGPALSFAPRLCVGSFRGYQGWSIADIVPAPFNSG